MAQRAAIPALLVYSAFGMMGRLQMTQRQMFGSKTFTEAFSEPFEESTPRACRSRTNKPDVPLDGFTAIPHDIYLDFMMAGEKARNRGQHRLEEEADKAGSCRKTKPRLVCSDTRVKFVLPHVVSGRTSKTVFGGRGTSKNPGRAHRKIPALN